MIVSIKQIDGHDGSGESGLAPAAQRAVEGVGAGAVRGTWGICSCRSSRGCFGVGSTCLPVERPAPGIAAC